MCLGRGLGPAPAQFAWPARPHLLGILCVVLCCVPVVRVSAVWWSRARWDLGMGCAGFRWCRFCRTRRACTSWHRVACTCACVLYISSPLLYPIHVRERLLPRCGMIIWSALVRSHQSTSGDSFGLLRPGWIQWYGLQISLFTCCDICNTSQVEF